MKVTVEIEKHPKVTGKYNLMIRVMDNFNFQIMERIFWQSSDFDLLKMIRSGLIEFGYSEIDRILNKSFESAHKNNEQLSDYEKYLKKFLIEKNASAPSCHAEG